MLKKIALLFLLTVASQNSLVHAVIVYGGQSFIPSVSGTTLGTTPAANTEVYLDSFTFVFTSLSGIPTTLYLASSLPANTSALAGSALLTSTGYRQFVRSLFWQRDHPHLQFFLSRGLGYRQYLLCPLRYGLVPDFSQ